MHTSFTGIRYTLHSHTRSRDFGGQVIWRVGWTRPVGQRGQALEPRLIPLFGAIILPFREQGKPLGEVVQVQLWCKDAARLHGRPEDADVAFCATTCDTTHYTTHETARDKVGRSCQFASIFAHAELSPCLECQLRQGHRRPPNKHPMRMESVENMSTQSRMLRRAPVPSSREARRMH